MRVDTLAEEFKEKRGSTLVGSSTSWGSEDSVDDGMNEIRHICAPYRSGCRRPKKMEAGFPVDCADAESVLVSRSGNRGIRGERVLETEAGRNGRRCPSKRRRRDYEMAPICQGSLSC
ncbi:hypothetical protein HPP92_000373 [Vanilla planifolia]|uniref:Uncharacterized protein n=1 Tax=Vanilla planifolia TaxID=51239 RepID=A0A835VEC4_VANPL|nr:hypothetical protein HPP92_000373 [Vanilla planifolia]